MIDLLVAGGGPAGLSAAIAGAMAGLEVAVLEPREGVIDKACGEGLMPGAVSGLEALGVRVDGFALGGIRYVQGGTSVSAPLRGALGVRRTALHAALLARAREVGVRHRVGRARGIRQDADAVEVNGVCARWLIAADGLRSRVRTELGLGLPARRPARLGIRRHFAVAPWTDHVEVHWAPGFEAYLTPVGPRLVGLAMLQASASTRGFDEMMQELPVLRERLGSPVSALRGAGPFEQRVRSVVAGRVLLVGDAAGYLDPITGEGVRLAVGSARSAVAAIVSGRPQDHARAWRSMVRLPWALTAGLLALSRPAWTRRRLVPALAAAPWIMRAVVRAL